jgi:hypothetical protein
MTSADENTFEEDHCAFGIGTGRKKTSMTCGIKSMNFINVFILNIFRAFGSQALPSAARKDAGAITVIRASSGSRDHAQDNRGDLLGIFYEFAILKHISGALIAGRRGARL